MPGLHSGPPGRPPAGPVSQRLLHLRPGAACCRATCLGGLWRYPEPGEEAEEELSRAELSENLIASHLRRKAFIPSGP